MRKNKSKKVQYRALWRQLPGVYTILGQICPRIRVSITTFVLSRKERLVQRGNKRKGCTRSTVNKIYKITKKTKQVHWRRNIIIIVIFNPMTPVISLYFKLIDNWYSNCVKSQVHQYELNKFLFTIYKSGGLNIYSTSVIRNCINSIFIDFYANIRITLKIFNIIKVGTSMKSLLVRRYYIFKNYISCCDFISSYTSLFDINQLQSFTLLIIAYISFLSFLFPHRLLLLLLLFFHG